MGGQLQTKYFLFQAWHVRPTKTQIGLHIPAVATVFVARLEEHCICGYLKCAQWRFRSDCAYAQSDLNRHWAHMSEVMCSAITAQIFFFFRIRKINMLFVLIVGEVPKTYIFPLKEVWKLPTIFIQTNAASIISVIYCHICTLYFLFLSLLNFSCYKSCCFLSIPFLSLLHASQTLSWFQSWSLTLSLELSSC